MSFLRSICAAMERIAPLRLAESWDNTGLLIEAPFSRQTKRVLLTIDMSPKVAEEAIASEASVVVAYHPAIFNKLKSFTLATPMQASLLRLAASGISLYCPHSALDSVNGGINDWLARAFGGPSEFQSKYITEKNDERGGAGRMITLPEPGISIQDAVERVKAHLKLDRVQLSKPYDDQKNIRTVAICAGSGGSMFGDLDADLLFTGEMQHHEVLAARGKGQYVILCGHTNTERGFLPVLKKQLESDAATDSALAGLEIKISEKDEHPLQIV